MGRGGGSVPQALEEQTCYIAAKTRRRSAHSGCSVLCAWLPLPLRGGGTHVGPKPTGNCKLGILQFRSSAVQRFLATRNNGHLLASICMMPVRLDRAGHVLITARVPRVFELRFLFLFFPECPQILFSNWGFNAAAM